MAVNVMFLIKLLIRAPIFPFAFLRACSLLLLLVTVWPKIDAAFFAGTPSRNRAIVQT